MWNVPYNSVPYNSSGRGATATLDAIEKGKDDPFSKGWEAAIDFDLGRSISETSAGGTAGLIGGLTGNATAGVKGAQTVTAITTALIDFATNLLGGTIVGIADGNSPSVGNGEIEGMAPEE